MGNLLSVDERSVCAAQVPDDELSLRLLYRKVTAGDVWPIYHDVVTFITPTVTVPGSTNAVCLYD